jgi:hypothetical protein
VSFAQGVALTARQRPATDTYRPNGYNRGYWTALRIFLCPHLSHDHGTWCSVQFHLKRNDQEYRVLCRSKVITETHSCTLYELYVAMDTIPVVSTNKRRVPELHSTFLDPGVVRWKRVNNLITILDVEFESHNGHDCFHSHISKNVGLVPS